MPDALPSTKTSLGVLVPFWLVTLAATILVIISSAGKFINYNDLKNYNDDVSWRGFNHSYLYTVDEQAYLAWGIVLVIASVATLIVNILSTIFLARKNSFLPAYLLFSNLSTLIAWIILLICCFAIPPGNVDVFQLAGTCILILTSAGQLAYGGVLYQRLRKEALLRESLPMRESMPPVVQVRDPGLDVPPEHREAFGVRRHRR